MIQGFLAERNLTFGDLDALIATARRRLEQDGCEISSICTAQETYPRERTVITVNVSGGGDLKSTQAKLRKTMVADNPRIKDVVLFRVSG